MKEECAALFAELAANEIITSREKIGAEEENIKWYFEPYMYRIYDEVAGNIDDFVIFADKTEENTKSIEIIVAELNKILTEK